MLLSLWILTSSERPIRNASLTVFTISITAILGVSGSRGSFVLVFGILIASQIGSILLFRRNISSRAFIFPLLLFVFGSWVIVSFFTTQFSNLSERALSLSSAETGFLSLYEIILRPMADMLGAFNTMIETPVFGYGLGAGGNAGWMLGAAVSAEGEWSRHLVDLGPFL